MSKEKIDKIIRHDVHHVLGFFYQYRFLSNFHICEIWYEGLKYSSTESAYQAAKLPPSEREEFTRMTPAEAMKAGRERHKEEDKAEWMTKRVEVMNAVLFEKFKSPELRKLLLDTGNTYLEETNWWNDTFWGRNEKGEGTNMLGIVLMNLRRYLYELERFKNRK